MSSQGPGWWQASDGKWYPPEQHPDAVAASPPPPAAPPATPPPAAPGTGATWQVPPGDTTPPPVPPTAPAGPPMAPPSVPAPGYPPAGPLPGYPPAGPPPGFAAPGAPAPKQRRRWGLLVAVLVVLVLLLAAVAWLASSSSSSGGDLDLFDLQVGDCFDDPVALSSDELVEVEAVQSRDCDEPHDGEVYLVEDLPQGPDDPYPGDAVISQLADQLCFEGFEAYVGAPYEESAIDYTYYLPSPDTWSAGDREVVCIAVDVNGDPLTGSVEGSGR